MLKLILSRVEPEVLNLPVAPKFSQDVIENVDRIVALAEAEIGTPIHEDYYKCSKDRFRTLLAITLMNFPEGSKLLDIGNAPGYLAMMLRHAGYEVFGVNLSDAWNSTYPTDRCLEDFSVVSCDIEKDSLPYGDESFSGIVFTEVLEHIAVQHPAKLMVEFKRVIAPSGMIIFSTPNVCNISNLLALLKGKNIFWDTRIFYGSTDRHNREFTPDEVLELFLGAGFVTRAFFGINDHANWRAGAADEVYKYLAAIEGASHSLLRNTIVGLFQRGA